MELLDKMQKETESCINCGFCESVCPTLPASGFISSIGARGRVDIGKKLLDEMNLKKELTIEPFNSFYSCLDCFACLQVCPAGVNAGEVSQLGREIITSNDVFKKIDGKGITKMIVSLTMKYKNPLGIRHKLDSWAEGLEFDDSSDTLFYTGNMYQLMAYTEGLGKIEKWLGRKMSNFMAGAVAKRPYIAYGFKLMKNGETQRLMENNLKNIYALLKKSGIKLKYLRSEEPYPGTFLHDLGYKTEFKEYVSFLVDYFKSESIKKIVVIDPHTYDLFKRVIPIEIGVFPFDVVYYLDLVDTEKFHKSEETVTFHEPCHLVLRNPEYNKPLDIVEYTGNLVMPPRSGKKTMCCGGPNELLFNNLAVKISKNRMEQLKDTGAKKIITACPICQVNLNLHGKTTDIGTYLASLS